MQSIKNSRWLPIVMVVTIIGITAFHVFSVKESYEREKKNLERGSFWTFRETIRTLQWKQDSVAYAIFVATRNATEKQPQDSPNISRQRFISMMNVVRDRNNDFAGRGDRGNMEERRGRDNKFPNDRKDHRFDNTGFFEFLRNYKQDSLKLKNISAAFAKRQKGQDMVVPFTIEKRVKKNRDDDERGNNEVVIGFINPVAYKLHLGNVTPYLINKISTPLIISLVIVGFTIFSFVLLYKNLLKQQRLADIKNEFISNITHELKTPIATVSVAIEALRNFNASVDPLRSKEYLDISANELQRLSLLVDKVLKLSMFEKKEVDLKYELLNMQDLVHEVTSSLRLQFEKHNADVSVQATEDTTFEGDRLHLVSVIFNLLDNALKYSHDNPRIRINMTGSASKIQLAISDNGIGIPEEYREKVFEKFFRVPTGNLHNAKGYGLGLSYVAQVVEKHHGTINVETVEGGGSKFVITLPKNKA